MSFDENERDEDIDTEADEESPSAVDPVLAERVERSLKKLGAEIADMRRRGL